MLGIASARVGEQRVRFVLADLFGWRPDRRYEVVFFGFWLSHVPTERFASSWTLVADCLEPDGRVFFVDDGYRTVEELIEGEHSPVIRRRMGEQGARPSSSPSGRSGSERNGMPPASSTCAVADSFADIAGLP